MLLRNCAVDFVEICNVYVGKMIIKAAKRIFHSDKICRRPVAIGVLQMNTVGLLHAVTKFPTKYFCIELCIESLLCE